MTLARPPRPRPFRPGPGPRPWRGPGPWGPPGWGAGTYIVVTGETCPPGYAFLPESLPAAGVYYPPRCVALEQEMAGLGALGCEACGCPSCPGLQKSGVAGLGELNEAAQSGLGIVDLFGGVSSILGGVLGGAGSIYAANIQEEMLKKQLAAQKKQQKFEAEMFGAQAQVAQQQAAVSASKEVRRTEIIALVLAGAAAVGVSLWLLKKARS